MSIVSLNNSTNPSAVASDQVAGQKSALDMAAEQFEAMFLQQVLKQMRKAGDALAADNPMRSRELDTMRDFYDGVLAENLSGKRQTGIADMLVKQLSGNAGEAESIETAGEQARSAELPVKSSFPQAKTEHRSAAMDIAGGSFGLSSLRNTWQRGVDSLENIWDKGSASFKALVDSVIQQESGGRVDAVSHKGALGVMQLMPDTARQMAKEMGVQFNLHRLTRDADYNKQLGSAFLSKMLDRYDGEQALALAAYNAGPARVDEWLERNGDPRIGDLSMSAWVRQIPFKETREYTSRILAELAQNPAANGIKTPVVAEKPFNSGVTPVALNDIAEVFKATPNQSPALKTQPVHDARLWRFPTPNNP
ncbi:transglycosylase SLT domain-containing protein [Cellvibrio sp. NN19]|uniref:transglycosylase SLT domain-containing protein n=1 Tax=Cellvibrio chitinivorans TaxID=3102792 RepID=UPI002B40CA48|nr:transglycosylase SLT domain-containing protein [Cellvibrio sp. NN19]